MFMIHLFFTILSGYFAKQSYDQYRFGWAMFWAGLLGWDLHALLTLL